MKVKAHFSAVAGVVLALASQANAALIVDINATGLGVADGTTIGSISNPGSAGDFSTLSGTVVTATHSGVQGLAFDNDKMVAAMDAPSVGLVGNSNYTVRAWVWNPAIGNEEAIVSWGHRGGPLGSNAGFHQGTHPTFGAIGHWGGGAIGNLNEPDVGWGNNGADINATIGQWAQLTYVWNGTDDRVFINGLLSASELHPNSLNVHGTYNDGNPTALVLGSESDAGSINGTPIPFSGTIARVQVWNTPMSDGQVARAFNLEAPDFGLVPEPSASVLGVLGLALFALRRKR